VSGYILVLFSDHCLEQDHTYMHGISTIIVSACCVSMLHFQYELTIQLSTNKHIFFYCLINTKYTALTEVVATRTIVGQRMTAERANSECSFVMPVL